MGAKLRTSLPGLTRQSIRFAKLLAKKMDARVKPAHDFLAVDSAGMGARDAPELGCARFFRMCYA